MLYRFFSSRNYDDKTDFVDVHLDNNNNNIVLGDKKIVGVSGFEIVSFQYRIENNIPEVPIFIENTNGSSVVTFPAGFYTQDSFITQLSNTLNSVAINVSLNSITKKITLSSSVLFSIRFSYNYNFAIFIGIKTLLLYDPVLTYTFPFPSSAIESNNIYLLSNNLTTFISSPIDEKKTSLITNNLYQMNNRQSTIFKFIHKYSSPGNNENVEIFESKMLNIKKTTVIDKVDLFYSSILDPSQTISIPEWSAVIRFYL